MRKETTKKKKFKIDNPFVLILLLLAAYLVYERFFFWNKINSNYKITSGIIYKIGGLRNDTYYFFNVNNIEYKGVAISTPCLYVGDSLQVRYYVPNPNINKWEGEFKR